MSADIGNHIDTSVVSICVVGSIVNKVSIFQSIDRCEVEACVKGISLCVGIR